MNAGFDFQAMIDDLIADEREVLTVYDDATGIAIRPGSQVKGHPTIGIGRALDVNGISKAESRVMCMNDVGRYLRELLMIDWWMKLDPVRQRAIMNMRHQLGLNGLLGFRGMIAAIERQDWPAAQAAGLDSSWHTQTPDRCERLMTVIRTGRPYDIPRSPPIA